MGPGADLVCMLHSVLTTCLMADGMLLEVEGAHWADGLHTSDLPYGR